MRYQLRVTLAVALALVVAAERANACECITTGPPCQHFFTVDAVFAGKVQSISIAAPPAFEYPRQVVMFSIERSFAGIQGETVEVITGLGGGDCGYAFKAGERYLVYAHGGNNGSRLTVSSCSRTR